MNVEVQKIVDATAHIADPRHQRRAMIAMAMRTLSREFDDAPRHGIRQQHIRMNEDVVQLMKTFLEQAADALEEVDR